MIELSGLSIACVSTAFRTPLVLVVITLLGGLVQTQKRIDYLGYRINVSSPAGSNHSTVIVKKGRHVLAKHSEGLWADYGSRAELISVLGSYRKQLVISQYTGGNHCCVVYWIYDLYPRFRLLFRSKDFQTDGYSDSHKLFQNLDRDRSLEIVDETPAFYYFDDLAFASSPNPTFIFDYDAKSRSFKLANRKFATYLLRNAGESLQKASAVKDSDPNQFATWMFSIYLDYVYAGREKEGRALYYGNKVLKKSGLLHKWEAVRSVLISEPGYKEIYKK